MLLFSFLLEGGRRLGGLAAAGLWGMCCLGGWAWWIASITNAHRAGGTHLDTVLEEVNVHGARGGQARAAEVRIDAPEGLDGGEGADFFDLFLDFGAFGADFFWICSDFLWIWDSKTLKFHTFLDLGCPLEARFFGFDF